MNTEEKIDLILSAVKVATKMEARGSCLEYEPQEIKISYLKGSESDLRPKAETRIDLMFRNELCTIGNWRGYGSSFDECLDGNLLCMKDDLEYQISNMKRVLDEINFVLNVKENKN